MADLKKYLIKDHDLRGLEYYYYDEVPDFSRRSDRLLNWYIYNDREEIKDLCEIFIENRNRVYGVQFRYVHNAFFGSKEYLRYHIYQDNPDLKGYSRPFRLDTFSHFVKKVKYL